MKLLFFLQKLLTLYNEKTIIEVQCGTKRFKKVRVSQKLTKGVQVVTNKFCGSYLHTLDEKNRFKMPAALRNKINGSELYLIQSPDPSTRCVYVYSEEGWDELCERLNNVEVHTEQTRRKQRKILSGVVCSEMDKNGRLTLNSALKDYAGIEEEIYIVGNATHIEFWKVSAWLHEMEEMEDASIEELNINF